jgi:hypothetical protein
MFGKYTYLLSEDTKQNWYAGLRYQTGHRWRTVVARPKMKIDVLISLFLLPLPLMAPENSGLTSRLSTGEIGFPFDNAGESTQRPF